MTLVERLKETAGPSECGYEYHDLFIESANKHIEQAQRIEELEDALTGMAIVLETAKHGIARVLNTQDT